MNWINISNTKGWDEISDSYGVKSVPQNFLVDPNGTIIKKNIELKFTELGDFNSFDVALSELSCECC